jgi:transcriptional regulator with XRE-family HTH domain
MHRLGGKIRIARKTAGLTLRQLGAATGVSASLLSQIENDRARPSVTTLYNLVGVLGLSLDEVLETPAEDGALQEADVEVDMDAGLARLQAAGGPMTQQLKRPGHRAILELDSGVIWEQLTNTLTPFVDHLLVTYPPHSSSSQSGKLYSHFGFEHIYMIRGELELQIEFETLTLRSGDSIAFECGRPHLFRNKSDTEPAVGVWFILGRHSPTVLRQITSEINGYG